MKNLSTAKQIKYNNKIISQIKYNNKIIYPSKKEITIYGYWCGWDDPEVFYITSLPPTVGQPIYNYINGELILKPAFDPDLEESITGCRYNTIISIESNGYDFIYDNAWGFIASRRISEDKVITI